MPTLPTSTLHDPLLRRGLVFCASVLVALCIAAFIAPQPLYAAVIDLTVDTTEDDVTKTGCTPGSADCSLRGAISNANADGDPSNSYAIHIPAGTYVLTREGIGDDANSTGDLDITKANTQLIGAGADLTIIEANDIDRVLDVHVPVTISNLRVTGGKTSDNGGGIRYQGTMMLTLNSVVVRFNYAANGAGIYQASGSLVLTDTTVISNTTLGGISRGEGGGIHFTGTQLELTDSTVQGNTAFDRGGGIYAKGGSTKVMINRGTAITDNQAIFLGGGIYIEGGELWTEGQLVLQQNKAANAVANAPYVKINGNQAGRHGGGIYALNANSNIFYTELRDNVVADDVADSHGGGIYSYNSNMVLALSTVMTNTADAGGGVYIRGATSVFTASVASFFQNKANNDGGGIFNLDGTVALVDQTWVMSNTANFGGGILVDGASAKLNLDGGIIDYNQANADGGGIFNDGGTVTGVNQTRLRYNDADDQGGAIYQVAGLSDFEAAIFQGNRANNEGGAIYQEGGKVDITNSCLVRNSNIAVVREGVGFADNSMPNNWWGAANGPASQGYPKPTEGLVGVAALNIPASSPEAFFAEGNGDSIGKEIYYYPFLTAPTIFCPTRATNLAVSMSVDPPRPDPGEDVYFSINITNTGPDVAHNVVLRYTLPVSLTEDTAQISIAQIDTLQGPAQVGTTYVFTNPLLIVGESYSYESFGSSIVNGANMIGTQFDFTVEVTSTTDLSLTNNLATVTMQVGPYRTVGGTVTGLQGSGLTLRNNGGDALSINANGTFTFITELVQGASFAVTVQTQPNGPEQTCSVSNGSGTVGGSNVTNVAVTCSTTTFDVGGTVSGLTGSGLVLRNNGGDDLSVDENGSFVFATKVADGAGYGVTVLTQPSNPTQTCSVGNGSGTVNGADVTSVTVTCSTSSFRIRGTVTGLLGSGLILRNNGSDDLTVAANGAFTFATSVANGTGYAVTVQAQPDGPAQTCSVGNGSGTVDGDDVTNVTIICSSSAFNVGGTVSGLTGSGLVLRNNGSDDLAIAANGVFTFATKVADGAGYGVTVQTQPSGQTCTVSSGSGTVDGAAINNVSVACDSSESGSRLVIPSLKKE